MQNKLQENQIPYFCFDRKLTVKDIKQKLKTYKGIQKSLLTAWILREATFKDVWEFLTPKDVWNDLSRLKRFLGRKKQFWEFTMEKWHELGKI